MDILKPQAAKIDRLIENGAVDKPRTILKKMAMKERMNALMDLWMVINKSPRHLKFFKENFSVELGALIKAEYNTDEAVKIYKGSIG